MKYLILVLGFVLISVQLFGFENNQDLVQSANEAYQAGDFKTAINQYEKLLSDGYQSADLHYNLANAHYRLNQVGKAVLHYEKAALLDPRDEDIQHNLEFVKKSLPDQLDVIPVFFVTRWWNELQKLSSPGGWAVIALLIFWGGIAGWILWLSSKHRKIRKRGFIAGVVLVLLSILPFTIAFNANKKQNNSQRAVVMVNQINLKSAPDEVSENLLELHEGTSLRILDEIGEWKKIRLSNGEEGWLEAKVLAVI